MRSLHFAHALSVAAALVAGCSCETPLDPIDAPVPDAPTVDAPAAADAPTIDAPAIDAPSMDAPTDVATADVPSTTDVPAIDAQPSLDPNCDPDDVRCFAVPPECDEGEVPTVVDGCWGECIPAMECQCETFDDCPALTGYSEVCYSAGHCGPAL